MGGGRCWGCKGVCWGRGGIGSVGVGLFFGGLKNFIIILLLVLLMMEEIGLFEEV